MILDFVYWIYLYIVKVDCSEYARMHFHSKWHTPKQSLSDIKIASPIEIRRREGISGIPRTESSNSHKARVPQTTNSHLLWTVRIAYRFVGLCIKSILYHGWKQGQNLFLIVVLQLLTKIIQSRIVTIVLFLSLILITIIEIIKLAGQRIMELIMLQELRKPRKV